MTDTDPIATERRWTAAAVATNRLREAVDDRDRDAAVAAAQSVLGELEGLDNE